MTLRSHIANLLREIWYNYAENFSTTSDIKWLPGKVTKITGPLSYVIELSDGNTVRRHVDHIKAERTIKMMFKTLSVMTPTGII